MSVRAGLIPSLAVLLASFQAFAADSYSVAASATQMITEHSQCRQVTNGLSKSLFVPTKTAAEWTRFRDNPPAGVTLSSCGFTESFESWTGSFPTGWANCSTGISPFSSVAPTQNATGATDGSSAGRFLTQDTGYSGAACMARTIDLTGYTNVSIDVTDYFGCLAAGSSIEVYFSSAPSGLALNANAAGTRTATFAARGSTLVKVIVNGHDCGLYADNLKFW